MAVKKQIANCYGHNPVRYLYRRVLNILDKLSERNIVIKEERPGRGLLKNFYFYIDRDLLVFNIISNKFNTNLKDIVKNKKLNVIDRI